jgi:hypothetical protein
MYWTAYNDVLPAALVIQSSITSLNGRLGRFKEAAVACFDVLSQHLSEEIKITKNHGPNSLYPSLGFNWVPYKCEGKCCHYHFFHTSFQTEHTISHSTLYRLNVPRLPVICYAIPYYLLKSLMLVFKVLRVQIIALPPCMLWINRQRAGLIVHIQHL